ncbi:NS protein [Punta Toro virus]|uniref:Non-structural protein NS-S n=1 Tax=Punta toro phlebovirus TaxID=11587 RepID=A0A0F6ZQU4_PTPV|nr:NS protein [Punta Toro virus]
MSNINYYARELPVMSTSPDQLKRVTVDFVPFGKRHNAPVSLYKGMEIPLHNLRQSVIAKNRLITFLNNYDLPKEWGYGQGLVIKASPSFFDVTIARISMLDIKDALKWCEPNIKRALSWPLTYPTLKFFEFSTLDGYQLNWEKKCDFATQICRVGKGLGLDDSLMLTYKTMMRELSVRNIPAEVFTGQAIEKEIAYIQLIRLMTALEHDKRDDCCQSELFKLVELQYEVTSKELLGNRIWLPLTMLNQDI